MQNVTKKGFVVLDGQGEFLAWCEHAEVATKRMREDPMAWSVVRCEDDVLIARARRGPISVPWSTSAGNPCPRIPVAGC